MASIIIGGIDLTILGVGVVIMTLIMVVGDTDLIACIGTLLIMEVIMVLFTIHIITEIIDIHHIIITDIMGTDIIPEEA